MLFHKSFLPPLKESSRTEREWASWGEEKKFSPHLPVVFCPDCVELEFGDAVDDGSKRCSSSVSAFTLLRWMDSVRNSMVKNRKPSCVLQLRLRRLSFRLLGGPMICCCECLRVFLRFWLFTLWTTLRFNFLFESVYVAPLFLSALCHKGSILHLNFLPPLGAL